MKYRNCIFDLYGTLLDIHTDEEIEEIMSGFGFGRNPKNDKKPETIEEIQEHIIKQMEE